ncbi:class I SAM-dependent methyltransferase, partial [Patescibacteria group bacterium AH-259-L05]|nr:class I SAM-dependent methyltransferase [Patescibacteria group bacterium AH-259-L05]
MKNSHPHFTEVAHKYRELRVTDVEPILYIKKKLRKLSKIRAADIGCGAGRYDLQFFKHLNGRLYLYCTDTNDEMLGQLNEYLTSHNIKNFKTMNAPAETFPLEDNTLDCMFSFSAIHHFDLLKFLKEAARLLKNNGYLFIYTRTRTQNSKNIWGKFFPLFNEKETRLYEKNELKDMVKKVPRLKLQCIKSFKYKRFSAMDELINLATSHHYSTFYLYTEEELKQSLEKFKQNIQKHFK